MRKHKKIIVNLALQGGGAHGAFTWGVLDQLLADGRIAIDSISGASAGAVNAVMLADGLARGGAEEAVAVPPVAGTGRGTTRAQDAGCRLVDALLVLLALQALPVGRAVKYCPSCGLNLLMKRCPGCSAEIEQGWKFCVTCGRQA